MLTGAPVRVGEMVEFPLRYRTTVRFRSREMRFAAATVSSETYRGLQFNRGPIESTDEKSFARHCRPSVDVTHLVLAGVGVRISNYFWPLVEFGCGVAVALRVISLWGVAI